MPDKNIDLVPLKNVDIPEFKQKIHCKNHIRSRQPDAV